MLRRFPTRVKRFSATSEQAFWVLHGMLGELTLLAKGEGTKASFKKLERKLQSTAKEVEEIIGGLKRSRAHISKLRL
jgi:hypothetical protein